MTRDKILAVMADIKEELKHETDPWEQRALEHDLQEGFDMLNEKQ